MKSQLLFALFFFGISANICGQGIKIDSSFNSKEYGYGAGTSSQNNGIYSFLIEGDGKIAMAGNFTFFNQKGTNFVSRILSNGYNDDTYTALAGVGICCYGVRTINKTIDGKYFVAGSFTNVNSYGYTGRMAKLNIDGTFDNSFTIGSGANSDIYSSVVQSDGKILIGGGFDTVWNVKNIGIARLNNDGTLDNSFSSPFVNNSQLGSFANVSTIAVQADSKIIIATSGGNIFRLNTNGTLDNTFSASFNTTYYSGITKVVIQSNGKILVAGDFTLCNAVNRNKIARLNSDGSIDNSFSIGTGFDDLVQSFSITSSKIIACGRFSEFNGVAREKIALLNLDGTLDASFNSTPRLGNISTSYYSLSAIDFTIDNKILLCGDFSFYDSIYVGGICKLELTGKVDSSFNKGAGASAEVNDIICKSDSKYIISGLFNSYDKKRTNRLAQINSNGSLDTTYKFGINTTVEINKIKLQIDKKLLVACNLYGQSTPNTLRNTLLRLNIEGSLDNSFLLDSGANNYITSMDLASDNKIYVGGYFTNIGKQNLNRLARINTDGTIDNTFNIGTGANGEVSSIAVQKDGKVIIGGSFTSFNSINRQYFTRLNTDGSLDNSFNIGSGFTGSSPSTILALPNGKIYVTGGFSSYNGVSRQGIVRINSDGSVDASYVPNTSSLYNINKIGIQSDGKIVAAVSYRLAVQSNTGSNGYRLIRLNTDGSLDNTFNTINTGGISLSPFVRDLSVQIDNKIMIVGPFISCDTIGRNFIARINNNLASPNVWNGNVNSAWDNSGNWSNNTVPTSTQDVTIASSNNQPAISNTVNASGNNININTGTTLTVSGSLQIRGLINNGGNLTSTSGTLEMNNTAAQTIPASTFSGNTIQNLTINNTAGVTLGGALKITGTLNLSSGTLATGGFLTIAPGAAIPGAYANLSGNVTLQQNIISQRGWRVFANPFATTQTLSSVASTNGITINTTANGTSGLTDARTFASNAWVNNTSGTIAANQEYALFIRGLTTDGTGASYNAGPTAFTYNVSGTLNTNRNIAPANTTDFIIVGNPYAAPVKTIALTGSSGGGSGRPYYTYQIAQGGTQTAQRIKVGGWVAAGGNSNTTNTIPVLGVIAYQPTVTTAYYITTSDINTSGTLQPGLFGVNDTKQLELMVEQNGDFQDKLFVRLDAAATAASIDNSDLQKLYNDNVNVYTINKADNQRLAIDARKEWMSEVPMGISALAGNYNFKVAGNNLPEGTIVILNDKLLNTQTELKTGTTYNFTISSDTASKGENRFVLNFSQKAAAIIADVTAASFTAKVLGNSTHSSITVKIAGSTTPITIKVVDVDGKTLKTVNAVNGTNTINLGNTAAGIKLLQVSNGQETIVIKAAP